MSEENTQHLPGGDLGLILTHLRSMDSRMATLEETAERRTQETRPIWEQVLKRFDGVEGRLTSVGGRLGAAEGRLDRVEFRLGGVETRLGAVETRLGEVDSELYGLSRKFRVFNVDLVKLEDKYDDLDERVRKLESEPPR